jgi:hypothetical protein
MDEFTECESCGDFPGVGSSFDTYPCGHTLCNLCALEDECPVCEEEGV